MRACASNAWTSDRANYLVYLAGPITGISYGECTDWRTYADTLLSPGIIGVSPMRAKEYLAREAAITHSYEDTVLSCAKGITTRDRMDVRRADLVLVNLVGAKTVSIGTVMEIAWADAYRVPVVVAMEPTGNLHEHPMIKECTGFRVASLEEACRIASSILMAR